MPEAQNHGNCPRRIFSDASTLDDAAYYDFPVLRRQPRSLRRSLVCLPCIFLSLTVALVMTMIAARYW